MPAMFANTRARFDLPRKAAVPDAVVKTTILPQPIIIIEFEAVNPKAVSSIGSNLDQVDIVSVIIDIGSVI